MMKTIMMKTNEKNYHCNEKRKQKEKKQKPQSQVVPVFRDILDSIQGIYGPACQRGY